MVLWNIQLNASKQERVFSDHKRTVNRICWHFENPDLLLSGSQDGTMKIWDLREADAAAKLTFQGQSEAVRDVQFNPFYQNFFGACFDNGTIQVWDMRKPNACERNITAHQGLVNCIDWHPEDRSLIASGGRDRLIKVSHVPVTCLSIFDVHGHTFDTRRSFNGFIIDLIPLLRCGT